MNVFFDCKLRLSRQSAVGTRLALYFRYDHRVLFIRLATLDDDDEEEESGRHMNEVCHNGVRESDLMIG